jgi:uncharacterized protein YjiS (DUF1127 family)
MTHGFRETGIGWQLPQLIQRVFRMLREQRPRRRTLGIIEHLSDRELKDIGLSQSDLMSIKGGMYFRDGSRRRR